MRTLVLLLKWMFSNSGIQYGGREPTDAERLLWLRVGRVFKEYRCKVCGRYVWSYKPVSVCRSFRCFEKNGGWR